MNIIDHPSPNFSERNSKISAIVLHYTGMKSAEEALERMCDKAVEVSAHYFISREGSVYNLVPENKKAWHAGVSSWAGFEGVNDYSIGIEIENFGHEHGYQNFTEQQINSTVKLCKNLIEKYNITPKNIIGHSDIAPERKEDPGEFFDWQFLAQNNIGLYHDIKFNNAKYENIRRINKSELGKLAEIGYRINSNHGNYQQKLITAFYRRFFPQRILLSKNTRYPENIAWDKKAETILNSVYLLYKNQK